MIIKKSTPVLFVVLGMTWIGLVSMPSQALADFADATAIPKHTEALTDTKGNVEGTRTTSQRGATTTETYIYTAGPQAGRTLTVTFNSKGEEISREERTARGEGFTSKIDSKGVKTNTFTEPDGSVQVYKYDPSGKTIFYSKSLPNGEAISETYTPGGTRITSSKTHPDGRVETITYDSGGKPALLTLKDKDGKVTTASPDGKGGFSSVVKGERGRVINTTYDSNGRATSATVKDKNGKVVSTTTTTYDGKGGHTSVTTDKNGKVVSTTTNTANAKGGYTSVIKDNNGKVISTTQYDKDGKVVSQSGKKQTLTAGEGEQSGSGNKTSSGTGPGKDLSKGLNPVDPVKSKALEAAPGENKVLRDGMKSSNTDWSSTKTSSSPVITQEKVLKQNTDWSSTKTSSGTGISSEKLMKQNTNWGSSQATRSPVESNKALQMHQKRR